MGELTERGIGVRLVAHPIFAVARDGDGKLTAPPAEARADSKGGSHNESFIHIHVERIDDAQKREESRSALEGVLADVRLCVRDWKADGGARQRRDRGAQGQSAAGAGRRHRGSDPVPGMAQRQQLHAARRAGIRRRGEPRSAAGARTAGSACCASRTCRSCDAAARLSPSRRRSGVLQRAEDADRHQGQREVARASPRPHGLHRREALRRRRRYLRRIPHRRPVHLRRLHAPAAHHSVSAPQDRRHCAPRRLRSRRAFRQGAGQRAGDLSARRAVPDRRGHALSQRARHHADRGAAARARAGAPRPLRPLRLGAGLRAARALRHARAPGDRRISRRGLQWAGQRVLSVFPGRPAGPRAFHHRPRCRRNAESRSRHAGRRHRRDRPHLDRTRCPRR